MGRMWVAVNAVYVSYCTIRVTKGVLADRNQPKIWITAEHSTNRTPVSHRMAADVLSPEREYENTDTSADTFVRLRWSYPRLLKGHPHMLGALTRGFLVRVWSL
jgi:hypothetical protein